MSQSKPFQCDICRTSYPTERGMKMHRSKSHKNVLSFRCECDMVFLYQYTLDRHKKQCNAIKINSTIKEMEDKYKQEIDHLKDIHISTLQKSQDILQNVTKMKTAPKTITNKQQTNQVVININTPELIPVTNSLLKDIFNNALNNSHLLTNEEEFANYFYQKGLKGCVVSTDKSRHVIEWLDGDNQNKTIKDSKGQILAEKTYAATSDTIDKLSDIYRKQLEILPMNADEDRVNNLVTAQQLCRNIQTKNEKSMVKFGTKIGDRAPKELSQVSSKEDGNQIDYNSIYTKCTQSITKLKKAIESNPNYLMLAHRTNLAVFLLKESRGFIQEIFKDEQDVYKLMLKCDDGSKIQVEIEDFFSIIREAMYDITKDFDILSKREETLFKITASLEIVQQFSDVENIEQAWDIYKENMAWLSNLEGDLNTNFSAMISLALYKFRNILSE